MHQSPEVESLNSDDASVTAVLESCRKEINELIRQAIEQFLTTVEEEIKTTMELLAGATAAMVEPLDAKILQIQELLANNRKHLTKIEKGFALLAEPTNEG